MDKEALISEIRKLTKRIGQAARNGVTELAERLRISRTQLAIELARRFDTWLLVNAEGKSEFVARGDFERRVQLWKERTGVDSTAGTAGGPAAEGKASAVTAAIPDPVREFFGEPIHVYTRRQALDDGVLIDVTPWAAGCFKHPVAFTAALWTVVCDLPAGAGGDSLVDGRVREVLHAAARVALDGSRSTSQIAFPFLLGTSGGPRALDLLAHCGPGDQAEPVITIGFPSDF